MYKKIVVVLLVLFVVLFGIGQFLSYQYNSARNFNERTYPLGFDYRYNNDSLGFGIDQPVELQYSNKGEDNTFFYSDMAIEYNDFLNGYFAPIEFIPNLDYLNNSDYISKLQDVSEEKMEINGNRIEVVQGYYPKKGQYLDYRVVFIFFLDKNLTIKGQEVYSPAGPPIDFNLDKVINEIVSSIRFY